MSVEERARYGDDALRALCARCRTARRDPIIEAFVLCPPCQRATSAEERERLVTAHPMVTPRSSGGADDPRQRVVLHRSTLVLDDGHPTHPKQVQGQEVVVTVTRPEELRSWWMRLLGVYPPSGVTVDVRKPGAAWFLVHGTIPHGGETSLIVRSVDE